MRSIDAESRYTKEEVKRIVGNIDTDIIWGPELELKESKMANDKEDKPSTEDLQELSEALFPGYWPKAQPLDSVVKRQWGSYKVLHQGDGYTVKELTILPGKSLSDQRHFKRDEHWLIVKGAFEIDLDIGNNKSTIQLAANHTHYHNSAYIKAGTWHRPYNDGTEVVKVIETWIGDSSEEDIERRNV